MCRAMEEMRAEAAAKAAAEAEQRKAVIDIKRLMKNLKMSIEQAFSALEIDPSEQEKYRKLVMA